MVPSMNAEYRKYPVRWVQRRDAYDLEAVYQKKEGEKGLLQVFLNGELCATYKTNRYRKGFIGFRWHDVKFVVFDLEVSGLLDQGWAREELKKLAVKRK